MLRRKLWRDIKGNWGAYLACISVLVVGLMLFVSFSLTLDSITRAQDDFYQKHDFADGFAKFGMAPDSVLDEAKRIDGIEAAVGRLVQDVYVYVESGEHTTTVRLIAGEKDQPLNRYDLREGSHPAEGVKELLVSPTFLTSNDLKIGDSMKLMIKGQPVEFTISGTASSPEFVYEVPNKATLVPTPTEFGAVYLSYETAAQVLGLEGKINDLSFSLKEGADFNKVKESLDGLLTSYGVQEILPRADQASHLRLDQQLVQLKALTYSTPVMFLLVAAIILYILLKRMVEQQRGIIGLLKAFGFTEGQILRHYLGYATTIGLTGGVIGGLAGSAMSYSMAEVYDSYYKLPGLTGSFSFSYLLIGTVVALLFCVIAGYRGARNVMALEPSEAMRQSAPVAGKKTFLERIGPLWRSLNTSGKMAARNLLRNKQRTILSIVGIAMAFSMMVATKASIDGIYRLVDFQFYEVQKYELKAHLFGTPDDLKDLSLQGVAESEVITEVPVTIRNGDKEKEVALTGLPQDASLYRVLADDGTKVELPSDGVVLSNQLATILGVKKGDEVAVDINVGDGQQLNLHVADVVPQYVGLGAYIDFDALQGKLSDKTVGSAVLLTAQEGRLADLRKDLQLDPRTLAIVDTTKLETQFEEFMGYAKPSQYALLFFAFLTGFAVIYNVNIISFAERERELATLMVLGMTEREIGRILFKEQAVLGALAVLVGIPLSFGMLLGIIKGQGSEVFNLPLVIDPMTFAVGLLGTFAFLLTAQWRVSSKIKHLSMLDVLNDRE